MCKSWRWALEQCTLENQLPAQPYWVISRKMSTSTDIIWHFGDSSTRRSYTINVPELSRARCLVSKHGWLLLFSSEPISSLFFFNPFSRARIDLPWTSEFFRLTDILDKHPPVFTLSAPPTSLDCVLFAIAFVNVDSFRISTCRRGETTWTTHDCQCRITKFVPIKDATFCASTGSFYWVHELGFIRTYNADAKVWRRFRRSTIMKIPQTHTDEKNSYMVQPPDKKPMICVYYGSWRTIRGQFGRAELESPPIGCRSKLRVMKSPELLYRVNPGKKATEVPRWLCMDSFRGGSWCISFDSSEGDDHQPVLFSWHLLDKKGRSRNCESENSIWIEPKWIQPSSSIAWTE